MRAKHGYRFVSSISSDGAAMLGENWEEFAIKKEPSAKDRARNTVYKVDGLGTVTISLQTGSITAHTDFNEDEVKKRMSGLLGRSDYEAFCKSLRCTEVGAHFTKSHGTARYVLEVTEPCKIPFSLSCSVVKYNDFHARFRLPDGKATIRDFSKGAVEGSPPPCQKRYSDIELQAVVNQIMEERGSVTPQDIKQCTGLHLSNAGRRLEKFRKLGILERRGRYPAIYEPQKRG